MEEFTTVSVKVSVAVYVAGTLLELVPDPEKFPFEPVNDGTEVVELDAVIGEPSVVEVEDEEEGAVPVPGELDMLMEP